MIHSDLNFKPVIENQDLVPNTTLDVVLSLNEKENVLVAEIDPDFAGGFELCEKYNIDPRFGANCLIAEAKRNDIINYVALLVPVGYKYNMSNVVRKQLNARMVSVAPLDFVLEQTKMECGSITPLGIPSKWHIFIDPLVLEQENVIIGGGFVKSKIMLPSKLLLELPNASVLNGLAKAINE